MGFLGGERLGVRGERNVFLRVRGCVKMSNAVPTIGKVLTHPQGLVFQRVGDGSHHAQFLDVGRVLVAVLNLELPLACCLDRA